MKIRILYFALLRDALGRAQEELEVPEDVTTVAGLREWLRGCGEPYATALGNARRVRAAVNQEMAEPDDAVKAGDEVCLLSAGDRRLIMSLTTIRVSEADFNPGEEIERLIESSPEAGGVASFVGVVRNRNDGNDVTHLTLEHYPAMTERALAGIVERARARLGRRGVTVIHRVGEMAVGERIVLVVVTSAHRPRGIRGLRIHHGLAQDRGPLLEEGEDAEGERWVDARESDEEARRRWGEAAR